MKHRQPRRSDWRKKPAKRKIKLWQRPEFNIDTRVTNGNFKMYINGVELLSLTMKSSVKRGVNTIAVDKDGNVYADYTIPMIPACACVLRVDKDGNVYADYTRPFVFADPKRLITFINPAFDA